jgi:hypothetical protein
MLVADIIGRVSAGVILIIAGLICIGATNAKMRELTVEMDLKQRWVTRIAGGIAAVAGLLLVFTDSSTTPGHDPEATSGPEAATHNAAPGSQSDEAAADPPLAANEIEIDHPAANEPVRVICETPGSCWVPVSGRVGAGTSPALRPVVLVAPEPGGDAPGAGAVPDHGVQLDATSRSGTQWTAEAQVENAAPGRSVRVQAVLVDVEITAPGVAGLASETARAVQGAEVVDESSIVQLPLG